MVVKVTEFITKVFCLGLQLVASFAVIVKVIRFVSVIITVEVISLC